MAYAVRYGGVAFGWLHFTAYSQYRSREASNVICISALSTYSKTPLIPINLLGVLFLLGVYSHSVTRRHMMHDGMPRHWPASLHKRFHRLRFVEPSPSALLTAQDSSWTHTVIQTSHLL